MMTLQWVTTFAACTTQAAFSVPTTADSVPATKQFPLVEKASIRFETETLNVASRHTGTATLKRQTSRKFTFKIPKNADSAYLQTCHRSASWYKPPEALTYNYVPALALFSPDPLEYAGNCLMTLTVITAEAKVQRAIVSFSGDETAPATVFCDTENSAKVSGHYLCQAHHNSVQAVIFDQPFHATWKDNCNPLSTKDNKGFALNLSPGLCVYAFQSFDKSKWFRLTTYGWTMENLPDYKHNEGNPPPW
jgi:hypothetical protein